ncbi:D-alanyl-D-alanine carboxypeptidase [Fulvitalea axinellae]|uniref:D-alanyl-D-alanine carboxypeptidase n=1 Tax=Fulvitalea axinellae TaxID=1182444 RepID=A0AAU9CYP8_9BACT|nr:D-alanyl-D-alanine carboxypeptidase [Fulvitalea axinellae]
MKSLLGLLFIVISLNFNVSGSHIQHFKKNKPKRLAKTLLKDSLFANHHFGFILFNPKKNKSVLEINPDKYFTPASNTKLLTLLTILGEFPNSDSLTLFKYHKAGDSLIVQGTGLPSLLHPDFNDTLPEFLTQKKNHIFLSQENKPKRFGDGWAWDDYPYQISAEISDFPIYGNNARFTRQENGKITSVNRIFRDSITNISGPWARNEKKNIFHTNKIKRDTTDIPFITSNELTLALLSDTLKQSVQPWKADFPKSASHFKTAVRDTLLKKMMIDSDNFIAEQLLLHLAIEKYDTTAISIAIDSAVSKHFADLKNQPVWRDGSGLSRYNLNTPSNIIDTYLMLERLIGRKKLLTYLAKGGETGTLKKMFTEEPRIEIFGKTGSMSNNFVFSGYLLTKKGETLLFCFMNTHFSHSVSEMRSGVERILRLVHQSY